MDLIQHSLNEIVEIRTGWSNGFLSNAKFMQADVHIDMLTDLVKHAQATVDRATVNDPYFAVG